MKYLCQGALPRFAVLIVGFIIALLCQLCAVAHAQERQTVLLAAHRVGRIEVLDALTLSQLGSIVVLPKTDGVASRPDGEVLFVRAHLASDARVCCGLYALDLKTRKMKHLVEPSGGITVSPDGHHVLTQRGNIGIEVYDALTQQKEPRVLRSVASGMYQLSFSPDGRLLFGTTNSPIPALDIFDFARRVLLSHIRLSKGMTVTGAWFRDDFLVYEYRNGSGWLSRVKNLAPAGQRVELNLPNAVRECEIYDQQIVGGAQHVFLYEVFGSKLDRRVSCHEEIPGGLLAINPLSGKIVAQFAQTFHFHSVIASPNGSDLYGVDVGDANWGSVSLVRLDEVNGKILAKRDLEPDIWFIQLASIPAALVPHGEVRASLE